MSDTPTHTAPERLLTITQLFGHNPHAALEAAVVAVGKVNDV